MVGAGTRVPFVQDELTKAVKMELSKNLNTDEAAVLGAVYKAADLSTGFKVKKFITRDAVLFPIQVQYCVIIYCRFYVVLLLLTFLKFANLLAVAKFC